MIHSLTTIQACLYTHHTDDIHYFTFSNPSHQAIDEWFNYLEDIYVQETTKRQINMLLDVRDSGLLPMTYIQHKGRRWLKQHPVQQQLYIAVLHGYDFPVSLAQTFTRVLGTSRRHQIQYFSEAHETDAIAWLLHNNAD